MKEYLLEQLFEKPISGEWGNEVAEDMQGVKVIRTTNFTNKGMLNLTDVVTREIDIKKYANKVLRKGDIIIEKSGGSPNQPVGRTVLFGEIQDVYFCNNFTAILRPNNGFNSHYLLYMLRQLYSQRKVLKFQNKTTGIINLKLNDYLNATKVFIHSTEKQAKIVNVLDKAQGLIDKRKEQIAACDELIKSLFYHMFGNIFTNDKNWNESKLDGLINVVGGYAFKSDNFQKEGVPVLRIGNINSGYFKSVNMVFWQEEASIERYLMLPGDLVISLTGTVGKDDYGNVCILGREYNKYYLNQRNAKLEIKENLNKYYLMYALKIPDIKKKLTSISRGIRQANIANRDILNLVLPVPPIDLQNEFAQKVEKIEHQKQLLQQSLTELETNFNALMQRAFKGELF